MGLANTQSSLVLRSFEDSLGNSDGRLALLALAPRSVLGYQPQADYVFPRAPDTRSSSYEWREVHWISN